MRSKKAILNVFTNLLLELIVIIYGFVVPKMIIQSFGSDVNGLISSITQFLGYIALLESGFGPVVKSILYKPIAKKNNQEILNILNASEKFFRLISYIFILYIIILSIIYPIIINTEFAFIYSFSLIIIISISTFAEYYFGMTYKLFLQADQKKYIISIIQIITYIINIITVIILVKMGMNIHAIKIITGLVFVIRPMVQNLYVKKIYKINLKNANKKYEIKNKWDGLAQHIAYVIHSNTDIAILTVFTNLSEVSVYSIYYLIVTGLKSLIQSFTSGIDASFGDMIAKREKNNLNKKFSAYEVSYNSISTIIFTSAIILIIPFMTIYTKGITDANYIRCTFGVLLVISEYIWAIRLPYSSITLAAGHFKETRIGAWIECISNILISIILVWKYGIVGVTIGTIVAMTIRTIEFIYHTNKYILDRSIWESIKKIILVIVETIVIILICKYLPYVDNTNYINWLVNAIMVGIVASLVTFISNYAFYKNEIKEVIKIFKNILNKKKITK